MPVEKNTGLQIGKWLIVLIVAVVALAAAANHFIRVPGPDGGKSTGIVAAWFDNLLKSDNLKNWEKSASFSGYGMDILFRHGPALLDPPSEELKNQRELAISHMSTALAAANAVAESYLAEVHPQLPDAYGDYKKSLGLFIKGVEENDVEQFNQANSLYNEFIAFLKEHHQDFKPLR